jgi:hypothetical protein
MPPRALQDAKDTTPDAQDAFCKNQGKGQIHPIRPNRPRIGQRFIPSAMAVAGMPKHAAAAECAMEVHRQPRFHHLPAYGFTATARVYHMVHDE